MYLLTKVTGLVCQPGLYVASCNPITTIPETVSEFNNMKYAAKLDTAAGVSIETTRAFVNLERDDAATIQRLCSNHCVCDAGYPACMFLPVARLCIH